MKRIVYALRKGIIPRVREYPEGDLFIKRRGTEMTGKVVKELAVSAKVHMTITFRGVERTNVQLEDE